MARLDAILGRKADAAPRMSGDKGSNKGPSANAKETKGPIRTQIGPMMAGLVPHVGCPANGLMRLSRVHGVPRRDV